MNPLIKRLVQERASQDATPQTIERNFDLLKTDRYYHFNITVKAGVSKVNVVCDRALALDPSRSKAVRETKHDYRISIPVFRKVDRWRNQLIARRAAIQKSFMHFSDPYWYVTADDLPELRDEVRGLFQMADRLRTQVLAGYNKAFERFLVALERELGRASNGSEVERDRWLESLSHQFPSRLEVTHNFGVRLEGPMPLELLVEAMEKSQQMGMKGAIELQQRWLDIVLESFFQI